MAACMDPGPVSDCIKPSKVSKRPRTCTNNESGCSWPPDMTATVIHEWFPVLHLSPPGLATVIPPQTQPPNAKNAMVAHA